jgi:hypothetical protein
MSSKQTITELGFDLTWPLISQPKARNARRASSVTGKQSTERLTGGFDLRWPVISRPE